MVDGDLVHLIDASESTSRAVVVERDCNEDTKEYFKHKLLSYGVGAEVPLKSLHGHRSQAPLPVRHICGKCLFSWLVFRVTQITFLFTLNRCYE